MKLYKQIIFILIVFLKTETLLSENNLFNVNNIQLEKKGRTSNDELTNQAIKKGFSQLIEKILLKQDAESLNDLNFSSIRQLVTYYQINDLPDKENDKELVNFSVTFDKEKIHNLFFKRGISYSDISDKELFILPLFIKDNEVLIFNNNYFYEKWNESFESELIEFILPLENIEIIKAINDNKNNLIDLEVKNLLKEYTKKNLALILIDDNKKSNQRVYIKALIHGKKISKSINFKKLNLNSSELYKRIITETKKELINLVKSENLIDIGAPSFLNVKLNLNKKSNFVFLNSKIKKIDLIENVYVQEFNKDFMKLRIKYLGKLEKIIKQLEKENIDLKLINEQWIIRTL